MKGIIKYVNEIGIGVRLESGEVVFVAAGNAPSGLHSGEQVEVRELGGAYYSPPHSVYLDNFRYAIVEEAS